MVAVSVSTFAFGRRFRPAARRFRTRWKIRNRSTPSAAATRISPATAVCEPPLFFAAGAVGAVTGATPEKTCLCCAAETVKGYVCVDENAGAPVR